MSAHVRYRAPPTVARFLQSDAFVRCIMGPLGSGKSSGCVIEILRRAREQRPGPDGVRRTRFAVIRNTYGQLQDTTRKTFEQWIPEGYLGTWTEADFTFHMGFREKDGTRVECEVLFRALDKPKDVRKVLSLELTGAYINEAREVPKAVIDGLQGRVGRYPAKADGGATWRGIWMDTNPWHAGHALAKLFKAPPEGFELYRQPSGLSPEAENVENLPHGYYQQLQLGKDSEWVDVYVEGKEAVSDKGAIFGKQMHELEMRGGLLDFKHRGDGVQSFWDLGIADAASFWLNRTGRDEKALERDPRKSLPGKGAPRSPLRIEYLDHYANAGRPLSHYFDELDRRAEALNLSVSRHWLPHDARNRTFVTDTTVLDQFLQRYGEDAVAIVPQVGRYSGIEAGRAVLEQPGTVIHKRCDSGEINGVEALREYRFGWDDDARAFSRIPIHNWASNPADSFRMSAVVARMGEMLTRPKAEEQPKPYARDLSSFTIDELFEETGLTFGERA